MILSEQAVLVREPQRGALLTKGRAVHPLVSIRLHNHGETRRALQDFNSSALIGQQRRPVQSTRTQFLWESLCAHLLSLKTSLACCACLSEAPHLGTATARSSN